MKTTLDIPEELLVEAKQRAAELRRPLRALVEGLGARLASGNQRQAATGRNRGRPRIRWVTVNGAPAPRLDVANRERMHEGLERNP